VIKPLGHSCASGGVVTGPVAFRGLATSTSFCRRLCTERMRHADGGAGSSDVAFGAVELGLTHGADGRRFARTRFTKSKVRWVYVGTFHVDAQKAMWVASPLGRESTIPHKRSGKYPDRAGCSLQETVGGAGAPARLRSKIQVASRAFWASAAGADHFRPDTRVACMPASIAGGRPPAKHSSGFRRRQKRCDIRRWWRGGTQWAKHVSSEN